jgi:hypothetical protein
MSFGDSIRQTASIARLVSVTAIVTDTNTWRRSRQAPDGKAPACQRC